MLVKGMEDRTIKIVEAYFSCAKNNCTTSIMTAYNKYVEFKINTFTPYVLCSATNYSPDCAQVVMQARPPVYASPENIMTSLLICAKLKSESRSANTKVNDLFLMK